jgi:hypothetical protein
MSQLVSVSRTRREPSSPVARRSHPCACSIDEFPDKRRVARAPGCRGQTGSDQGQTPEPLLVMPAFLPTIPGPRGPARRRRSGGDCPLDQCRIVARRRFAAFDPRRPGCRRRQRSAAVEGAVPSTHDVEIVDDHHGLVSALCRRAGTSVATDYTDNTDRVCEIASRETLDPHRRVRGS